MKRTITKFMSGFKNGFAHWSIAISFTLNIYILKISAKFERKPKERKS